MREEHRQTPLMAVVANNAGERLSVEQMEDEVAARWLEVAEWALSLLPTSSSWAQASRELRTACLLSLDQPSLRSVSPD